MWWGVTPGLPPTFPSSLFVYNRLPYRTCPVCHFPPLKYHEIYGKHRVSKHSAIAETLIVSRLFMVMLLMILISWIKKLCGTKGCCGNQLNGACLHSGLVLLDNLKMPIYVGALYLSNSGVDFSELFVWESNAFQTTIEHYTTWVLEHSKACRFNAGISSLR
jgi:hypothetical protein